MKLKLHLALVILVLCVLAFQWSDAGLLRRSRRLRRIGPPRRGHARSARVMRMGRSRWPSFLAPPRGYSEGRQLRRHPPPPGRPPLRREEMFRRPPGGHQLRLPLMASHDEPVMSGSAQLNTWQPLEGGRLVDRDPTYDYAPPSLDRVRFSDGMKDSRKRKPHKPGRPEKDRRMKPGPRPTPSMFGRPRYPSIWKLLATKQRRRPPPQRRPGPFMRYPETPETPKQTLKEEAEIFPRIPNIMYFQHRDVIPTSVPRLPTRLSPVPAVPNSHFHAVQHNQIQQNQIQQLHKPIQSHYNPVPHIQQLHQQLQQQQQQQQNRPMLFAPNPSMKPGMITNVPLYSHENQSPSLFTPVTQFATATAAPPTAPIPRQPDDILYRPQEFMNPTRSPLTPPHAPTILQPVKSSTPDSFVHATRNSAMRPVEPTQSILNVIQDPPTPLNSFSILSSVNNVLGRINSNELTDEPVVPAAEVTRPRPAAVFIPPPPHPSTTTTQVPASFENEEESTTIQVSTSVSHSTSISVGKSAETSSGNNDNLSRNNNDKFSRNSNENYRRNNNENFSRNSNENFSRNNNDNFGGNKEDESEEKSPATVVEISTTAAPKPTARTITTTTTTTSRYARLPEMPTYKKRQPIYPKRITPIKATMGRNQPERKNEKSDPASGEAIVVMSRSKVKNYKPQFLANYTQLLTFDKVEEGESEIGAVTVTPSLTKVTSNKPVVQYIQSSPTSTTSSPEHNSEESSSKTESNGSSPLQDFDPMQLLHSWFQNT